MLIGPFSSDRSNRPNREYINIHDGRSYQLGIHENRLSYQAEARTYGDVLALYRWHSEPKSLGPEGSRCGPQTRGLLLRTPVIAGPFRYIGKESDRRWEQGEEISMIDTVTLEYRPNETERLTTDPELQAKLSGYSPSVLASATELTIKTVKAVMAGKRHRRATYEKLEAALRSGLPTKKSRPSASKIVFRLDESEIQD